MHVCQGLIRLSANSLSEPEKIQMKTLSEQQLKDLFCAAYADVNFSSERAAAMKSVILARIAELTPTQPHTFGISGFGFDYGLRFLVSSFQNLRLSPQYALVAVFLLIGISTGGTVWAAAGSLPGDRLYPLKVNIERGYIESLKDQKVRLSGRISFAARRLGDLERIKAKGTVDGLKVKQATDLYMRELSSVYDEIALLEEKGQSSELRAVASLVDQKTSALKLKLQAQIDPTKPNGLRDALTTTRAINRRALKTLTADSETNQTQEIKARVETEIKEAGENLETAKNKVWAAGLGKISTRPALLARASEEVKVLVARPDVAQKYLTAARAALANDPKVALEKMESTEFLTSKTNEELASHAGEALTKLAEQVSGPSAPFPKVQGGAFFSPARQ